MIYLFSGCQDAEVPLGQSLQPAAKLCVSVLFDKLFAHFFEGSFVRMYVCMYQRLVLCFF